MADRRAQWQAGLAGAGRAPEEPDRSGLAGLVHCRGTVDPERADKPTRESEDGADGEADPRRVPPTR